ncbi:hypothetical protein KQI42_15950 [Tissierella sp. MSJ-40]|uniref:Uncharacterized protein n=1 Tax=Tissierella simiarum TaxID=2841534 RepID=A0ABS6EBD5_9FIRM|nr:hypothetical protein [Tissierella simiarum]MBU5439509.1 hypothetical protein [Tissierella simiarum]
MAYIKTVWKNREVERPRTFTKVDNADGTITLVPSEGKIIEQGTPIIAANMNNIENGIEEAITKAEQAFQSASDGKTLIAGAITGKGVPTNPSDTFQKMADNISAIETDKTGDATAVAGDILSGKTAYVKGKKLTGTMPNRGAIDNTITTQGGQIAIPAGYHNGSGKVKAQFPNLDPNNIKKGINIGGVVGNYVGGYSLFVPGAYDDPYFSIRTIVDKVGTSYETICNFKTMGTLGRVRLKVQGYKPAGGSMSFRLYKNNSLIETQTFDDFTGGYAYFDYPIELKLDDVFKIEAKSIRSDNSYHHDMSDGSIYWCQMQYWLNISEIFINI